MSSLVQDDADDAVVEAPTLEEEILRDMFAVWIDLFLSGNHGTVMGQSWDSHGTVMGDQASYSNFLCYSFSIYFPYPPRNISQLIYSFAAPF